PLRAGTRAAVARTARAAEAVVEPGSDRPVRFQLRRHPHRWLRPAPGDQGAGGGMNQKQGAGSGDAGMARRADVGSSAADPTPVLKLSLIAALDRSNGIGRDNTLPWHLPDDFRHFKALTLGKPILMGRKTAESLGRALPGRTNLVLTRSGQVPFAGMRAVASLDEARAIAAGEGADELCVIGGGEIYRL